MEVRSSSVVGPAGSSAAASSSSCFLSFFAISAALFMALMTEKSTRAMMRKLIIMLMMPRKNNFDLWDDMFREDPFFRHEPTKLMKTDIRENDNGYTIDMDLPGFEKENISLEIEDGYLNVHASTSTTNDDEKSKYIRKERFYGECSRNFYVGEDVTEEDIKATFKNGILTIEVPKKEPKKEIPEKKYIPIGD